MPGTEPSGPGLDPRPVADEPRPGWGGHLHSWEHAILEGQILTRLVYRVGAIRYGTHRRSGR
jgi:hypothetical protein